jgi:tetratricopeptide (TPR) repeat protein
LGLEHTNIADTMDELGGICYYEGDYEKGIEYCNEVLNIRLKALNENHKDVASSYNNLGLVYHSKGLKFIRNMFEKIKVSLFDDESAVLSDHHMVLASEQ